MIKVHSQEKFAEEIKIPVTNQRFWLWTKRENHTNRPYRQLTAREEVRTVGKLCEEADNPPELKLFVEDLSLVPKQEILLFFKLYEPVEEKLSYVGRLFVKGSAKPRAILTKLKEMAIRFAPDEEIELFVEIRFKPNVMCKLLDKELTFRSSELKVGDIICIQKSPQDQHVAQCRYPDVLSFLKHVHNHHFPQEEKNLGPHDLLKFECPPQSPSCAKQDAVPLSYINIKVARNEDLVEQIGKKIYSNLVDYDEVPHFQVPVHMLFVIFKEKVAEAFRIPVQYLRFWIRRKREKPIDHPYWLLTPYEEAQPVGLLRQSLNDAQKEGLKLFLEINKNLNFLLLPPPEKTYEDILLFFKLYDPFKLELRYLGWIFVKGTKRPIEILPTLNELAGFPRDEEIELFQEIKFEHAFRCVHVNKKLSFCTSQLKDDYIICIQKSLKGQNVEQRGYLDVAKFMEYVHNRQSQVVRSRSLGKAKR